MSRKSRTASYLALGRIWHDTGNTSPKVTAFGLTTTKLFAQLLTP